MKKLFKANFYLMLLSTLILAGVLFSGCNNSGLSMDVNDNMITESRDIVLDLASQYYNKLEASKHYTLEELERSKDNYYVLVGTLGSNTDISEVSFGNVSFKDTDTISLSVGLNAFIDSEPYYVEDNKVYVAAPIVAMESIGNHKVKINGSTFDLPNNDMTKLEVIGAGFSGTQNSATHEGDVYNVDIKTSKEFVTFGIKDMTENTNIALTRKLYTYPDGKKTLSYGLTAANDTYESVYGVGLYVVNYNADDLSIYDGMELNYTLFVIDKDGEFVGITDDLTIKVKTEFGETTTDNE